MNTLKETNISPKPELDLENSIMSEKVKTPLKKEELEKIAKELKKKLSKASITAKQQQLSPVNSKINKNLSPLNNLISKKTSKDTFESPSRVHYLSSSSPLYSPNNKSPTHIRNSAAISLLSSSPIIESPIKKSKNSSPLKNQPTMVLQSVSTPSKSSSLKPSPSLNPKQTTPTLSKKQLNVNTSVDNGSGNPLLRTPTQSKGNGNGNYNDEEGADLLMYLATSPSPAKNYFPNTPKLGGPKTEPVAKDNSAPTSSALPIHKYSSSNSSANSFIAPPPPLTPKRHINSSSKTPQNRLTPSINLFNNLNPNLPSSGLALTPAGFNMNDYVNFFSPSPGGANLNKNLNSNFLKTPDFNNLLNNHPNNGSNLKQSVDGKMINFDKVGLFKGESKD